MVFYPPAFVEKLPEVPDTVPICDFMLDEKHGRRLKSRRLGWTISPELWLKS
jgi:hypothetical protein